MEKKYNEVLDYVLKEIKGFKNDILLSPKEIGDKLRSELASKYKLEHWESILFTNHLVEEDYINTNYKLTFKGFLFIENGGYIQQKKYESIKMMYEKWTTIALIFGGLLAGVYYLVELLSKLWNVF